MPAATIDAPRLAAITARSSAAADGERVYRRAVLGFRHLVPVDALYRTIRADGHRVSERRRSEEDNPYAEAAHDRDERADALAQGDIGGMCGDYQQRRERLRRTPTS